MVTKVTTGLVKALPYIFRYVSRILVALNGYKLPQLFSTMGKFFAPTGGSIRNVAKSLSWNPTKWFKGDSPYAKQIRAYYGEGSVKDKSFGFTKVTSTVEENTAALKANTSALTNQTTGVAASTGASSQLTSSALLKKYGDPKKYKLNDQGLLVYATGKKRAGSLVGGKTNSAAISSAFNESVYQQYNDQNKYYLDKNNILRYKTGINQGKRVGGAQSSAFLSAAYLNGQSKAEEAANAEKAAEKKMYRKQMGARAFGAAATGLMAGLTAQTQVYDAASGQTYQMSDGTAAYSRISTGVVAGALSFINPILGMIGSTAMDAINKYFIGPLFE